MNITFPAITIPILRCCQFPLSNSVEMTLTLLNTNLVTGVLTASFNQNNSFHSVTKQYINRKETRKVFNRLFEKWSKFSPICLPGDHLEYSFIYFPQSKNEDSVSF
jgi:hypothetical protein